MRSRCLKLSSISEIYLRIWFDLASYSEQDKAVKEWELCARLAVGTSVCLCVCVRARALVETDPTVHSDLNSGQKGN